MYPIIMRDVYGMFFGEIDIIISMKTIKSISVGYVEIQQLYWFSFLVYCNMKQKELFATPLKYLEIHLFH